jgi:hypothetical protein
MTSPVLALRQAILAAVAADAELAAAMGGTVRVYDDAPRAAEPVYAVFGNAQARDLVHGSRPRARTGAPSRGVGAGGQLAPGPRGGRAALGALARL